MDEVLTSSVEVILPGKMKTLVRELGDASMLLQHFIIRRDMDEIWKILSLQQEKITLFEQYKSSWFGMMKEKSIKKDENLKRIREEVENEIEKLKKINQGSERLIKAFQLSIQKALNKIKDAKIDKPLYNESGKIKSKNSLRRINSTA